VVLRSGHRSWHDPCWGRQVATPAAFFLRQSEAVIGHDASAQLGRIAAPTQLTVGRHDLLCSTRFADELTGGIAGAELVVSEDCAHAPIYENVQDFNARTLAFLQQHSG
jgi:pimeloyl-ACP methyl ester carboxylesterase